MANNWGWVKTHRQIWDNEVIWNTSQPFDNRSAWIDLVMLVNSQDKEISIGNSVLLVRRGQKFTSIRKLAERWHWSVNKTRRYIELLCDANMVTKDSTHGGTLLTIVNYGIYQGEWHTKRNTNEYTGEYTDGTPTNTQAAYKQEYKEYKEYQEDKNINLAPPAWGGEWE